MRHTLPPVLLLLAFAGAVAPAPARPGQLPPDERAPGVHPLPGGAAPRNVLFILADDLGVDALSTYDLQAAAAPTPNLSRLAAEGVLFRNAYAHPVCSPTRTAIMTGLYPVATGVALSIPFDKPDHPNGDWAATQPFLPTKLPAPYRSFAVGKWHLDASGYDAAIRRGFDEYRGSLTHLESHHHWDYTRATATTLEHTPIQVYSVTQQVDDALELIRAQPPGQAWFVYLALHAPHDPFEAPPAHLHTYGNLAGQDAPVLFRAMIESVDTELGRLFASLGPELLDRTTVIFAGDNGTPPRVQLEPRPFTGGKASLNEGGVRVPLIVRSPLVRHRGREVSAIVDLVDLHATILDLVGAQAPRGPHSVSLVPYLRDPKAPPQRAWVHARKTRPNGLEQPGSYDYERGMVRESEYKLIRRVAVGEAPYVAFYHLPSDPFEDLNLVPNGSTLGLTLEQKLIFERMDALLGRLGGP